MRENAFFHFYFTTMAYKPQVRFCINMKSDFAVYFDKIRVFGCFY